MAKAATKKQAPAKAKVVEAALSAGAGGGQNVLRLDPRAIEQAMSAAVAKAHKAGVTDPDKIRKAMLDARESAKAEHKKAEKAAIAAIQAEAEKPASKKAR